MKKLIIATLASTMAISTFVFANSPAKPTTDAANTVEAKTPLIAIDRDTLESIVTARDFAENYGYEVIWNGSLKTITFEKDDNILEATVDSNIYILNGEEKEFKTKTKIIDGIAYIPQTFANALVDTTFYKPITPEIPIDENLDDIDVIENTIEPLMDIEIANIIAEDITEQINVYTEEKEKYISEYKEAFLATGGNISEYIEPIFDIGYKVLSQDENYISINIYKYTAAASSNVEEIYLTYDVKTGEIKSLESFLGAEYETYVKESVLKIANERMKESSDEYIYDITSLESIIIDENTSFYLDDARNIVVVFDKYEIASGSMGVQEFIIPVIKILN